MAIPGINASPEELLMLEAASQGLTPDELSQLRQYPGDLIASREPAGTRTDVINWFKGLFGGAQPTPTPTPAKKPAGRVVGPKPKATPSVTPTPSPTPTPTPSPTPVPAPTAANIPGIGEVPTDIAGRTLTKVDLPLVDPRFSTTDIPPPEAFDPTVEYVSSLPMDTLRGMAKNITNTQIEQQRQRGRELPPDLRPLAAMVDFYAGTESLKGYKPETEEDRKAKIQALEAQTYEMAQGLSKQEMALLESLLGYKFAAKTGQMPKLTYEVPGSEKSGKKALNVERFRKAYTSSIEKPDEMLSELNNLAQSSYTDSDSFRNALKVNPIFGAGYATRLSRIMGEKGALSKSDVEPYKNLNPDAYETLNRAYDKFITGSRMTPQDMVALRNYVVIMRDHLRGGLGKFREDFLERAEDYEISPAAAERAVRTYTMFEPSPEPMSKPPPGKAVQKLPAQGGGGSLKDKIRARKAAKGL